MMVYYKKINNRRYQHLQTRPITLLVSQQYVRIEKDIIINTTTIHEASIMIHTT